MIKFFEHINYRYKILQLQNQRSVRPLVEIAASGRVNNTNRSYD